jgi:hypothetical protein
MIVAGVVIETTPGAASRVAARLRQVTCLDLHGSDGDRRLAAVLVADDGVALEALADRLVHEDAEVLAVLPTYVADDDERGRAPAGRSAALRLAKG